VVGHGKDRRWSRREAAISLMPCPAYGQNLNKEVRRPFGARWDQRIPCKVDDSRYRHAEQARNLLMPCTATAATVTTASAADARKLAIMINRQAHTVEECQLVRGHDRIEVKSREKNGSGKSPIGTKPNSLALA